MTRIAHDERGGQHAPLHRWQALGTDAHATNAPQDLSLWRPYYPEHWSPAYWERDAQRMAEAGFNVVRMAEFAWDRMEPVEGQYDFSLFQEVIAIMGRHGIATILCTPTATPPRWLTHAHPDVLRVLPDGRRCTHGSRQHACYAGERYRAYSRAITQAMAAAFKDNAHVVGWQTDNEINCGPHECICPNCQTEFRRFLESRYGTIETLNEAWGTAFWAQTYQRGSRSTSPAEPSPQSENPSARLTITATSRTSPCASSTNRWRSCGPPTPTGSSRTTACSTRSITSPSAATSTFSGTTTIRFRVDTPPHPLTAPPPPRSSSTWRAVSPEFHHSEQQSRQGQKHYLHDNPRPGQMRLWSYQSIAHGPTASCTFAGAPVALVRRSTGAASSITMTCRGAAARRNRRGASSPPWRPSCWHPCARDVGLHSPSRMTPIAPCRTAARAVGSPAHLHAPSGHTMWP